jgi:DNA-directed RNA polymerase subunit F
MNNLRKAAEQALEYLNKVSDWDTTYPIGKAKEELRQALAQPVDLAKVGEVGVWGKEKNT